MKRENREPTPYEVWEFWEGNEIVGLQWRDTRIMPMKLKKEVSKMRKYFEATNKDEICSKCKGIVPKGIYHYHILAGIGHSPNEKKTEFTIELEGAYFESMRICQKCLEEDVITCKELNKAL